MRPVMMIAALALLVTGPTRAVEQTEAKACVKTFLAQERLTSPDALNLRTAQLLPNGPRPKVVATRDRYVSARTRKVAVILTAFAPGRFTAEFARYWVEEHDRWNLPGETYWHSLCYAHYGSGFKPGMTYSAGGMTSRGLLDNTNLHLSREQCKRFGTRSLLDAWLSVANHCAEASEYFRKTGRRGWSLLRKVFLPRSPDGQRARQEEARWRRLERAHLQLVKEH